MTLPGTNAIRFKAVLDTPWKSPPPPRPLCDLVSQQTWPIISACHWELFRGINRAAAAEGEEEKEGTSKVARYKRSLVEIAHAPRLRYTRRCLPIPCKSVERLNRGRNGISAVKGASIKYVRIRGGEKADKARRMCEFCCINQQKVQTRWV